MAVEVVILVPVLVAIMLMIVAFGRYVDTRGQVDAVARDAVRAASLQRDAWSALNAAQAIVDATVPDSTTCQPVQLTGPSGSVVFAPGQIITVQVTCDVSFQGLGLGLPGSLPLTGSSSAPLDTLRRTE